MTDETEPHKDPCCHQLKTLLWKTTLSDNFMSFLFPFDWHVLSLLHKLSLFFIAWYRNWAAWISIWCRFCDISMLLISFWGPMEATVSSCIMSNRLICARELRTSSLKSKDFCFHHLQYLFVEGNIKRQLYLRFFKSFWLDSWAGLELQFFAVNVEWQRRRFIGEFCEIVTIRSPPSFF